MKLRISIEDPIRKLVAVKALVSWMVGYVEYKDLTYRQDVNPLLQTLESLASDLEQAIERRLERDDKKGSTPCTDTVE